MASIRFSVRDHSDASRPSRTATARTPSSLRSKIQAGSVKRSWVSVASIGAMNPAVVMSAKRKSWAAMYPNVIAGPMLIPPAG